MPDHVPHEQEQTTSTRSQQSTVPPGESSDLPLLPTLPTARSSIPPEHLVPAPFPTWLYSALLGNSRLLVCLDETGTIAQLFYPYIDAGPHIRSFLTGIQVTETTPAPRAQSMTPSAQPSVSDQQESISWLASPDWTHELHYVDGAAVLSVLSQHRAAGIRLERRIAVHPDRDLLSMDVSVHNLRATPIALQFIHYAELDFDHRRSANCSFFDPSTSLLICFASDRYIAFCSADAPVTGFACEKTSLEAEGLFTDINAGRFSGREYAIGQTSNAIRHDFGVIEAHSIQTRSLHLCFGRSLDDVRSLATMLREIPPRIAEVADWWRKLYADAVLPARSDEAQTVYNRSLMVLRLFTDRTTGGIIAAAENDPDFRSCGGYGMCWPRDGAFNAHALDVAGQHAHAREFYDWALRVQSKEGAWYQRYYVEGTLAPTWGLIQFDEIGAIVWAICRHIQLTEDTVYGEIAFPRLTRACEYMQHALDPDTGLAPLTKELWEERDTISTYACASTWGAFHEMALLATLLNSTASARWAQAAARLKSAIETHLWDASRGYFRRGIKLRVHPQPAEIARIRQQAGSADAEIQEVNVAGTSHFYQRYDPTVDASSLALSLPFGVFSPTDPRMLATANAVTTRLTSPVGGIYRYQGDYYRDGNPWVISTLWLAWQDLLAEKQESALALYRWVLEHRTALDLLPEQVDRTTGEPCWIVPLGWSHAMFLLISHALSAQGLL